MSNRRTYQYTDYSVPVEGEGQSVGLQYAHTRPVRANEDQSDFMAGLKHGATSYVQTGAGLLGYTGAMLGADSLRDWGYEAYHDIGESMRPEQKDQYRWEGVQGAGDALDFAQYWLGNGLAQMGAGLGVGALGAKVAKAAARGLVEREVAKYLARKEATGALTAPVVRQRAEAVLRDRLTRRAANAGFTTGMTGQAFGQALGATYGKAADDVQEQERTLDDIDLKRVTVGGLAAGVPEAATDLLTAGLVRLGPAKGAALDLLKGSRPARVLKGGVVSSQVGGLTEMGQTGLEDWGAGRPDPNFTDPTSYFAGAIAEGAIGSLAGLPTPASPRPAMTPEAAADAALQETAQQYTLQQQAMAAAEAEAQAQAEEDARRLDLRLKYQPAFATRKEFIRQRVDAILADEMADGKFRRLYDEHRREALSEGREPDTEETFKKGLAKQLESQYRDQLDAEWATALDRFAEVQEERQAREQEVARQYANSAQVAAHNDGLIQRTIEEDDAIQRARPPQVLTGLFKRPAPYKNTRTIHEEANGVPIAGYEQMFSREDRATGLRHGPKVAGVPGQEGIGRPKETGAITVAPAPVEDPGYIASSDQKKGPGVKLPDPIDVGSAIGALKMIRGSELAVPVGNDEVPVGEVQQAALDILHRKGYSDEQIAELTRPDTGRGATATPATTKATTKAKATPARPAIPKDVKEEIEAAQGRDWITKEQAADMTARASTNEGAAEVKAELDVLAQNDQTQNVPPPAFTETRGVQPRKTTEVAPGPANKLNLPVPEGLSPNELRVFNTLADAVATNDFDQFVQAGANAKTGRTPLNYGAIATAAGLTSRQAAYTAVTRIARKIAGALGTNVDAFRSALQGRARAIRATEEHDIGRRGLSPAQQQQAVDDADIFGNDGGASAGMGRINTVNGSQGEVGERDLEAERMAQDRPDPVAERRATEAKERYEAMADRVLAHPLAAEAIEEFEDFAKVPASDLSRADAYDMLTSYLEYKETANEEQLLLDWKDIARRYDQPLGGVLPGEQGLLTSGSDSAGSGAGGTADRADGAGDRAAQVADGTTAATEGVGKPRAGTERRDAADEGTGTVPANEAGLGDGRKYSIADGHRPSGRLLSWLNEVFRRRANAPHMAVVPTPSEVMRKVGIYRPVYIDIEHARHIFNTHPDISPELLATLPSLLRAPRLVMVRGGSYRFVVDARVDGRPVTVVLNKAAQKDGPKVLKVAEVSTAFGLDESLARVAVALRAGEVKYVRQNEVARLRDLLHGESISPLTGTGYAPPGGGLEVTVASDGGDVNLTVKPPATYTGVQYSQRRTAGTAGQDAAKLEARLKGFFNSPAFFHNKVQVVQDENDPRLPAEDRQSLAGMPGKVQGFFAEGKVWIIASNVAPGKELAVFLHEAGVHMGMENLLGPAHYARLIRQLEMWEIDAVAGETTQEAVLVTKARHRVERAKAKLAEAGEAPLTRKQEMEELLAYFVEEAVNAGVQPTAATALGRWFRTLWAAVKVAVRKLGMNPAKLTAQDVVDLAMGAARMEVAGSWHGTAARFRRFDHKFMGSGEGMQAYGRGSYLAQRLGIAKEYWEADVERKSSTTTDGVRTRPEGSLMRTDTDVKDDELLDWDKPLSEQSDLVKKALEPLIGRSFEWNDKGADVYRDLSSLTLMDTYRKELGQRPSDKAASEYLDSIGIKGIKFLDANSRGGQTEVLAQTRNIVIFNDKNIHRVFTEAGADPASRLFSIAPSGAFTGVRDAVDDFIRAPLDEKKLGWMTLEQLADRTDIQSLRQYISVFHKMQALSRDITADASSLDREWAELGDVDAEKLGGVMVRSTLLGFDPTRDKVSTAEQARLKADLAAIKGGEELYGKVRDFYADILARKRAILQAAAKRAGKLPAEVDKMLSQIKGPYFPLMRMGEWYAVMMSDEVKALMDKQDVGTLSATEGRRLAALRKDPAHYMTRAFDSRRKAQEAARQSGFAHTYVNKQEERTRNLTKELPDFARLEAYIGAEFDATTREKLRDMLADMYYDMLPNHSALKQQMTREGIHGATFGRSEFARSALGQAHLVSRLQFADELDAAMQSVRGEARRGNIAQRLVYNELEKRNALAMDAYQPSWLVEWATTGSYFANLGLSPAYWITNLLQTPMITMPWLGARHGFRASNAALAKAVLDVKDIMRTSVRDADGKLDWRFEFDWRQRFPEGTGEHELFKQMRERDKLDITIEHDLTAVAEGRHTKLHDMVKLLNTPVRSIELVNRGATALAAYRLGLVKFQGDQQKAIDHAIKAVNDTQLDYSTLNAARHMQVVAGSKSLARIMMQFRKFQQGMVYLILTSAYDGLLRGGLLNKGARTSPAAVEARRTLYGIFATTGLMAGALGLPGIGSAAFLANMVGKAFDDDDEPFDAEVEFKNFIVSTFGRELGEVVLRGLPSLANADLTRRVGMADVFNPVPFYRSGSTGQESANNLLAAVAGAPFGTAANILDGLVTLGEGDVLKASEKIIPIKLAQNSIRTYRYGTEGLTEKDGDVVLPEDRFSPWDLTLRAMGFATTEETDYYEANQAVNDAMFAAKKIRSRLIRQIAAGELGLGSAEVAAFNRRHPGNPITFKVIRDHRKRTANQERTESGVLRNDRTEDYLDRAAFAGAEEPADV